MNTKYILVLVSLGFIFIPKIGYCAASIQVADSTASVSADSGTLNLQDRYIFTAARDIGRYANRMPDSVLEGLKAKLGLKEACANFTDKSNCKVVKDLQVPQEYLAYFKIKPGFYVKEFRGFEQVYSGTVSQINFSGHYDENSQEYYEFYMVLSGYHGDDGPGAWPDRAYVLSSSSEAMNAVRPLRRNEYISVTDTKRLDNIRNRILSSYHAEVEREMWSRKCFMNSRFSGLPTELSTTTITQFFSEMPPRCRMPIPSSLEGFKVFDVLLPGGDNTQLVFHNIEDEEKFCPLINNKWSELCEHSPRLNGLFIIDRRLFLVMTVNGGISLYYGEETIRKYINLYSYDD